VLHDAMMRGLHVSRIELDEAWSFVAKKQRHLKPGAAPQGLARPDAARGRARFQYCRRRQERRGHPPVG
jgi:hypothetical protein